MFRYTLSFACNFREFTDLLTLIPVRSLLISGLSTNNKLRRGLRKEALGHQKLGANGFGELNSANERSGK